MSPTLSKKLEFHNRTGGKKGKKIKAEEGLTGKLMQDCIRELAQGKGKTENKELRKDRVRALQLKP